MTSTSSPNPVVDEMVSIHRQGLVSGLQIAVDVLQGMLTDPLPGSDAADTLRVAIKALNAGIAVHQ